MPDFRITPFAALAAVAGAGLMLLLSGAGCEGNIGDPPGGVAQSGPERGRVKSAHFQPRTPLSLHAIVGRLPPDVHIRSLDVLQGDDERIAYVVLAPPSRDAGDIIKQYDQAIEPMLDHLERTFADETPNMTDGYAKALQVERDAIRAIRETPSTEDSLLVRAGVLVGPEEQVQQFTDWLKGGGP